MVLGGKRSGDIFIDAHSSNLNLFTDTAHVNFTLAFLWVTVSYALQIIIVRQQITNANANHHSR